MNRIDFVEQTIAGMQALTWYDPTYIDPSDLSAVDNFDVMTATMRPYILVIDGNKQAFSTEEQRTKYLDWRISLVSKKGKAG